MGKTVIIGGGVAGLTAGIYGRLSGLDCIIIEKNKFTGGNLTGWERKGHYIDNCLHWLNGTKNGSELNNIWRTVGMLSDDIKLIKMSAFYSVERRGQKISLFRNTEKTLKAMCAISPIDEEESKKFINAVRLMVCFNNKDFLGKLSVFHLVPLIIGYSKITLGELAKKFRHPLLSALMTDYFSPNLSALSLIIAYSAFVCGDADVPVGGSKEAAKRMENRYLALGGKLITSCEAKEIIIEGKRVVGVRLGNGNTVKADRVIACCDPSFTFGKLVPEFYMPSKLRRAYKSREQMPIFSAIQAAFSCDLSDDIPQNPVAFDIDSFNIEGREVDRMLIKPYRPSEVKMPEGKAVLQVMFYLYENEADRWIRLYENKEKYRDLKNKFADEVAKRIINHYPSLQKSLKLLDVWTPASYKRYFNSNKGAFLSFAITPGRAMIFNVPSKIKGIDNLYIATQWQKSIGGLPNAALNAKRSINQLTKSLKKKKTTPNIIKYSSPVLQY